MDNQSEVIQLQMEETRTSLQDKLETLEQQVKNTVQDATEAVSDTVENVKEAVQETVDTVKDTVQGTVQTVKDSFDLSHHIQTYPWTMFIGATAMGFVVTRWMTRDASRAPSAAAYPGVSARTTNASVAPAPKLGIGSWIAEHYRDEIDKAKGLAVGTLGALVRDALVSATASAPELAERIKSVANGFTDKLGGTVIEEPLFNLSTPENESTVDPSSSENERVDFGGAMKSAYP
jgi:ElaB/YqjD/DUF883 family membrane-anchored ribosome-binding protein